MLFCLFVTSAKGASGENLRFSPLAWRGGRTLMMRFFRKGFIRIKLLFTPLEIKMLKTPDFCRLQGNLSPIWLYLVFIRLIKVLSAICFFGAYPFLPLSPFLFKLFYSGNQVSWPRFKGSGRGFFRILLVVIPFSVGDMICTGR